MSLTNTNNRPTTFYLVRHAETLGNIEERLIGQSESPLTENGVKQAEELAKKLKDVRFGAVYASDLSRSIHTAQIIAKPHSIRINICKQIKELSFGKYEGWKSADFMAIFGEIVKQREQMGDQERLAHLVDPEIETDLSAAKRMARFLRKTAPKYPNQNVLVVSHGAILRSFLIYTKLFTYQKLPHGSIKNCGYIVLKNDASRFYIEGTSGIEIL